MNESKQLALMPMNELMEIADPVAKSGMLGCSNRDAVITLMLICQADGLHPVEAIRIFHIIENKPSMRSDAMLAKFQAKGGGVIWHSRNDNMVTATFFADAKTINEKTEARAKDRCEAVISQGNIALIKLSAYGEETLVRTLEDAKEKGLTAGSNGPKKNWKQSPRQMLTARVITEGIRLIAPGIVSGIYTPDEIEDFDPEQHVALPSKAERDASAEQAVKAAVENSTGASEPETEKEPEPEKFVLTEENYGEVVCHAGSEATHGKILNCKIKDIKPKYLTWIIEARAPTRHQPLIGMDADLVGAAKMRLEVIDPKPQPAHEAASAPVEVLEKEPSKEEKTAKKAKTPPAPKMLSKDEKLCFKVSTGPCAGKEVSELSKEEIKYYGTIFTPKTQEDHQLQAICLDLSDDLPWN